MDGIEHPAKSQALDWDTELSSFGLRVGTKRIAFFAEAKVRRMMIRYMIGIYPRVTVEEARKKAKSVLHDMEMGIDPPQPGGMSFGLRSFPAWFKAVLALKNDKNGNDRELIRDLFLMCLFLGLRRGEALNMRWEHVDLKAKAITSPRRRTASRRHSDRQLHHRHPREAGGSTARSNANQA